MMGDTQETVEIINRFVQSVCHLGMDLAKEIEREQGCEPGSSFEFVNPKICSDLSASNYYEQKIQFCRANIHINSTNADDFQLRKRISHFVASKADLIYKLKGKERLRCGVDYDADGSHEAYSLFATQVPPLEFGMKVSPCARRAQMFQILKVGDVIIGEVVGKRPFGVFVRVAGLIHGRNLDFSNIDIQALCHKSELEKDHKSREHLDPIDDFQINDIVRGVICSVSVEEERIAISFRSSKIPSEYGNIELGIVEDTDEHTRRTQSFDEDREYIEYLEEEPGFANPRNVQTLLNVLGIDSKPPSSLLRSCQRWSFDSQGNATNLRKQQSMKWSMDTTAVGVENFKSGCHEKAMKCFNHALQIYEENAEALVARGALYANQNQLENAIKDFREALNVHPNHHNASKYLKETLFEKAIRIKNTGNVKEAIEVFQEVLDFDPTNAECLAHLRELQAVMSAKDEDDSSKKGKASVGSAKESHQFEHVRKLIEADQELVRSSRKKKRKKKKRRKGLTRKKRAHHKEVSDESTSTASEQEHFSDNEWVEKKLHEKPSPKRHGGNRETLPKAKGGIASNRLKSSDSNNLAGEKHPLFSAELTGFEGRRKSEESGGLAFCSNSGVSNCTRMELKNEREVAPRRGSIKALGGRDSGSIVNVVHKGAKDFRWEIQGGLKKQGRESRSRSVESAGGRGGSRRKSRDSSESGENEKCRNRKSENRSRSNSRGSRDAREKNVGNPRPRDGSVKVRKEKSEMMIRSSTRISISSRSRSRSRSRGKRNESRNSTRSRSYGRSRSSSGSEDISCKGNKERTPRRNKHRSRSRVRSQKRGRVRNASSSVSSKDRSLTRSKSRGGSSERSSCKNQRRSQHEVRFRSRSQRRGLQRRQGRNRSRERSRSASLRRIRRRKRSRSYDRSLKRSEKRTTWRRSRSRNESFTGASSESSDGSKKSSEKKYQRKR